MPIQTGLGDLSPSQLGLLSKLRLALPYVQMAFANNLIAVLHLSRAPLLETCLNEVVAFLKSLRPSPMVPRGDIAMAGKAKTSTTATVVTAIVRIILLRLTLSKPPFISGKGRSVPLEIKTTLRKAAVDDLRQRDDFLSSPKPPVDDDSQHK
jgi:hypothetical protein